MQRTRQTSCRLAQQARSMVTGVISCHSAFIIRTGLADMHAVSSPVPSSKLPTHKCSQVGASSEPPTLRSLCPLLGLVVQVVIDTKCDEVPEGGAAHTVLARGLCSPAACSLWRDLCRRRR